MNIPAQLARHLKEVHFGVNWTWSNLRDQLKDVTWQQATAKVHSLNTIVALVYHIHYYIAAITKVLEGRPLDSNDKYAFDHPPINSEEDWQQLLQRSWTDAEHLANLIEQFPESRLDEVFVNEKYGTYYRNFQGMIEHTHYHLGQIVVIKKMLQQAGEQ